MPKEFHTCPDDPICWILYVVRRTISLYGHCCKEIVSSTSSPALMSLQLNHGQYLFSSTHNNIFVIV